MNFSFNSLCRSSCTYYLKSKRSAFNGTRRHPTFSVSSITKSGIMSCIHDHIWGLNRRCNIIFTNVGLNLPLYPCVQKTHRTLNICSWIVASRCSVISSQCFFLCRFYEFPILASFYLQSSFCWPELYCLFGTLCSDLIVGALFMNAIICHFCKSM